MLPQKRTYPSHRPHGGSSRILNGCRQADLRGLRNAIPRLLIVDAFEDKIVTEDEPIARGPAGPGNRPSTGVTVTSTATSVVAVTFTSISMRGSPFGTADLGGPHDIVRTPGVASGDNPLYLGGTVPARVHGAPKDQRQISEAAGDARRTTTSTSRPTRVVIAALASPTFARSTPAGPHLLVWRDQICTEYCGEAFPLGPLLTPPPGEVTASIVNAA
jgi:hypothetical protein